MARYTGADCKRCRREKTKLFLKGAKCDSPKCPIEIRPYPPGEHGRNRPKESEYLLQVREKQKAKRIYGMLEKQFHNYYEEATRKRGKTGEVTAPDPGEPPGQRRLPGRLRQEPGHGPPARQPRPHPGQRQKVDIPSYRVEREPTSSRCAPKSHELTPFIVARAEAGERPAPPGWRSSRTRCAILVHTLPVRAQIDTQVQEQLIVEYYSK